MSNSTYERMRRLALPGLCATALYSFAPLALAQIIIPTATLSTCGSTTPGGTGALCDEIATPFVSTGDTCGFERGATGCTANDFVGNATVTSNTLQSCHIGDPLTNQSLTFTVQSSSSTRYAPGLFIGEQNQTMNAAHPGDTCSVATFPTASTNPLPARVPYPWFAANSGDVCGSYSPNFTSTEQIDGVNIVCNPDVNGNLTVTFMIVYAQNAAGAAACTGPANVHPGTTSKCTFGGTPVTNVTVTYNANPTCAGSLTYDPVAGTVTATFTLTNNGPDSAGPALGGDVSFDDVVPAPAVVTGATCSNALGGAVCPASVSVAGNDVSGTIPTFPSGGSVDITISGTVPPGQNVQLQDTMTLSVNGTVVVVPSQWANTCAGSVLLPVHLQDFDVK